MKPSEHSIIGGRLWTAAMGLVPKLYYSYRRPAAVGLVSVKSKCAVQDGDAGAPFASSNCAGLPVQSSALCVHLESLSGHTTVK